MIVFPLILMALSIASIINVNGIHECPKKNKVFSSLRSANCDIYLPQETHVTNRHEGKLWESEWGGQAIFSPGSNRSESGKASTIFGNLAHTHVKVNH